MSFLARFAVSSLLTLSVAQACPTRDVNGTCVDLQAATEPTTVVLWSIECAKCGKAIVELEKTGRRIVVVNTDPTTDAARLRPAIRVLGLQSPVVPDPMGTVRARLAVDPGRQQVVLDPTGRGTQVVSTR